ncbi:unnamed protein product [Closterium sp. NIES-53]
MASGQEMDASKEVPIIGNEGYSVAAAADIDLNQDNVAAAAVDLEINQSEAEAEAAANNEVEADSAEGVSSEDKNIGVKLQTQITEQETLIEKKHCRIQDLEADSAKLRGAEQGGAVDP